MHMYMYVKTYAEAKVVVGLRGELLLAELEEEDDLAGQRLGRLQPLREEHHLCVFVC